MSWMDEYRARLKPADEALSVVQSGQRVYVHQGCAEPEDLIKAMVRRAPELWDVEVMHLATMGSARTADRGSASTTPSTCKASSPMPRSACRVAISGRPVAIASTVLIDRP